MCSLGAAELLLISLLCVCKGNTRRGINKYTPGNNSIRRGINKGIYGG
jgi:hypothetical protein